MITVSVITNSAHLFGFILTVWIYIVHRKESGIVLVADYSPNLIDHEKKLFNRNYRRTQIN